ncbi:hypothetical protein PV10_06435 [Exophiala mesophila]|uniref:C2H2-type domain-containing protein n=1 Tax=Exophiala mesophila TaxID=212818 RepID=A0A0D1ZYL2_EXOME|nr:uncharacterized protein PV10_06435 [Exophiala mesophila]KIV91948.1 hypothetical protein PV10_06435 [Exophiala mesophila]
MATVDTITDVTQTHPYTCNSCAVAFRNSDAQRTHMRSDWHRYNLKRRLAELPAVSSQDYNEKVLAAQATNHAAAAHASFAKSCTTCQKTYYSENAYQNHIASKAHKLREFNGGRGSRADTNSVVGSTLSTVASETPDPEAEAEFEKVVAGIKDASIHEASPVSRRPSAPPPDADPRQDHPISPEKPITSIPISQCLFCNYDSPTWKLNMGHMTKIHGLFVPEQTYLVDPEGLLKYMQAKVFENFECLWCHKLRGSAEGVQTHMRDKGHCKIAFEKEEEMVEFGQFYDFSSTYSDAEEDDSEDEDKPPTRNGGVKLSSSEGAEEDGWETDSSFSSLDTEELASVPIDDRSTSYSRLHLHRHHSHSDPRPHKTHDGFHSHAHHHNHAVFYDEHEMYLPSGRIAGHRNLRTYYRQNLHSYPTAAERMARAQRLIEEAGSDAEMEDVDPDEPVRLPPATPPKNSLMRRGEAGMLGVTAQQRKDVRNEEIKSRRRELRSQNRYQARLEKQNNHQKHFRVSFIPAVHVHDKVQTLIIDFHYRIHCFSEENSDRIRALWFCKSIPSHRPRPGSTTAPSHSST